MKCSFRFCRNVHFGKKWLLSKVTLSMDVIQVWLFIPGTIVVDFSKGLREDNFMGVIYN